MDWARPMSYSVRVGLSRLRPRLSVTPGQVTHAPDRSSPLPSDRQAVDADVWASRQPPLSLLAIKVPDG
jgi:hypothetical protein